MPAAPIQYGDSTHWWDVKADAADVTTQTCVPIIITLPADLIAAASRADGLDIVPTLADGTAIPRDLRRFSKGDVTGELVCQDPAQSSVTGGTQLYLQVGGATVNVANSTLPYVDAYGGATDAIYVYPLDEAAGDAIDHGPNGYNGTVSGCGYDAAGAIGKALTFDGDNDNINSGDLAEFDGATNLTVVGWAKQVNVNAGDYFWVKYTNSARLIGVMSSGGNLRFYQADGNSSSYGTIATPLSNNTWAHIAWVFDGAGATDADKLKGVVDGVNLGLSYPAAIPAATDVGTANALIGRASLALEGTQDEYRAWAATLSVADVQTAENIESQLATNGAFTTGTRAGERDTHRQHQRVRPADTVRPAADRGALPFLQRER